MCEQTVKMKEHKLESKCIYCGESDIVHDIHVGLTNEIGDVGLSYSKFITGTEPVYADLCTSCGSIIHLHVHKTDRKWITKKLKP
jgi:predicted RNA-binding Zn-ribbon protein involved in translation (DUF1610 family)